MLSRFSIGVILAILALTACASEGKGQSLSHLLRIQISVEFDGERIDLDETIACGARQKSTLTSGYSTQIILTRYRISHVTRDGGLLSLPISWMLCYVGADVWWPGTDAETAWYPPTEYLPPFRWVDAVERADRTYGEEYVSETYLASPNARLKILTPMQFSIPEHPASREALRTAYEREDWDNPLWEWQMGEGETRPLWREPYIIPISAREWGAVEELNARLERARRGEESWLKADGDPAYAANLIPTLPAEPTLQLITSGWDPKFEWFWKSLRASYFNKPVRVRHLEERGIPRRGAPNLGLLPVNTVPGRVSFPDQVIPLVCSDGVAKADFTRAGMLILRRERCAGSDQTSEIEIRGRRTPYPAGFGHYYFDARDKTVYVAK